jgi:hypothetical protein
MRPARTPLSRKHVVITNAIDRARCCGFEPNYQEGIRACAVSIAEEMVVPGERASFLIACGLDAWPLDG